MEILNSQKDEESYDKEESYIVEEIFIEDQEFEKKLLRKIDFRIIPLVTLLYCFSFLDR
jgi:hypothetical protein